METSVDRELEREKHKLEIDKYRLEVDRQRSEAGRVRNDTIRELLMVLKHLDYVQNGRKSAIVGSFESSEFREEGRELDAQEEDLHSLTLKQLRRLVEQSAEPKPSAQPVPPMELA